jgi:hypothetical protein
MIAHQMMIQVMLVVTVFTTRKPSFSSIYWWRLRPSATILNLHLYFIKLQRHRKIFSLPAYFLFHRATSVIHKNYVLEIISIS